MFERVGVDANGKVLGNSERLAFGQFAERLQTVRHAAACVLLGVQKMFGFQRAYSSSFYFDLRVVPASYLS